MDLKKYFTDEELNNMRPRIIRQFSSKDKLNDGFGVRDYNADNHWRDCDEKFSLLGKKNNLNFTWEWCTICQTSKWYV